MTTHHQPAAPRTAGERPPDDDLTASRPPWWMWLASLLVFVALFSVVLRACGAHGARDTEQPLQPVRTTPVSTP